MPGSLRPSNLALESSGILLGSTKSSFDGLWKARLEPRGGCGPPAAGSEGTSPKRIMMRRLAVDLGSGGPAVYDTWAGIYEFEFDKFMILWGLVC